MPAAAPQASEPRVGGAQALGAAVGAEKGDHERAAVPLEGQRFDERLL